MKYLSKLTFCLLALLFFVTGCSSFFKRTPAQIAALPKHYVMTLHGVRGNEKSYGDFHQLVEAHLEKIDPSFDVIPLNFTYETAKLNYTPSGAAAEINRQLDLAIKENGAFKPEDKISVVAYSMGGQVGVAWYFDSLKDPKYAKYAQQTLNFISLGAAYWGAQEAGLLTNDVNAMKSTIIGVIDESDAIFLKLANEYGGTLAAKTLKSAQTKLRPVILGQLNKLKTIDQVQNFYDNMTIREMYKLSRFGDWAAPVLDGIEKIKSLRDLSLRGIAKISFAELQALSIAGPVVTQLRTDMMNANKNTRTKWTSISTLVPCFESDKGSDRAGCNDFQNKISEQLNLQFGKYNFGVIRRETDNAVITPSSIAQFHYAFDFKSNYADGELTPASDFRLSLNQENHKAIFAETLHATLVTTNIYDRAFADLGKLGKSWSRLADDVVIVHAEKCTTPEKCDHPVYKYVLDELSDCDQEGNKCSGSDYANLVEKFHRRSSAEQSVAEVQNILKGELHGFTLELNLRLPKGYDTSKITISNVFQTAIKADFAVFNDEDRILKSDNGPYKIHLGRAKELSSILMKTVKYSDQTHLKVNFTGLITTDKDTDYNAEELQKGVRLKFSVNLPGLKSRQVEAVVSPYHSTFVDLTLAK